MVHNNTDSALLGLGTTLKSQGYRFTAVTPVTHTLVNNRPGNEWARNVQDILGWSRPFRGAAIPSDLMALLQQANVLKAHEDGWRSLVRASTIDDALFFHSAYPTDDTDAVFFGPDTYRFVAAIQHYLDARPHPVRRAADIGCGAGPGAITLALCQPQATVLAIDINDYALNLTKVNSMLAGAGKVVPLNSHLLSSAEGEFDLIIANPPYLVDPARRAYRHGGGPLGAGLSLAIVQSAMQRLSLDGALLLYTGVAIEHGVDSFRTEAEKLLESGGFQWTYKEVDPDVFGEELAHPAYSNADRIAAVVLTVYRQN